MKNVYDFLLTSHWIEENLFLVFSAMLGADFR